MTQTRNDATANAKTNLEVKLAFVKDSLEIKKVKVAHTRLPSVGFRSWSRFLTVSMQVTWVINPAVCCYYFPPGLQLPPPHNPWLLPILLLGEQRHNGCKQFAWDCYPTASRLRFEPGLSAPESSTLTTRLPSHPRLEIRRTKSPHCRRSPAHMTPIVKCRLFRSVTPPMISWRRS